MSCFYLRLAFSAGILPATMLAGMAQVPTDLPRPANPESPYGIAHSRLSATALALGLHDNFGSISSEDTEPELLLYPNPALEQVRLHLPAAVRSGSLTLTLHDRLGRVVRQWRVTEPPAAMPLDVRGLARGTYLLRVAGHSVEGRMLSRRVVLQ